MKAIQFIASICTFIGAILTTVVNYHVVKVAAPDYFTMWAVCVVLFFVSLTVRLASIED